MDVVQEAIDMPLQTMISNHTKSNFIDGSARSLIVGASAGAVLGAAVAGEVAAGIALPVAGAVIVAGINFAAYQMGKRRTSAPATEPMGR